jgi:hypothetical protein
MDADAKPRAKRKATPAQAAYLSAKRKQTKKWRLLWKTKPELMEAFRVKATQAAASKVRTANQWIQEAVKEWPDHFTPDELTNLALDLPYRRKARKRRMPHASLVRRLRSMGLLSYDPALGRWINHTRITKA